MRNKAQDQPYMGVNPIKIGAAQPIVNQANFKLLARYIRRRYSVHLLKDVGASRPWTDDPILDVYKFTNVKREHDFTTRYFLNLLKTNAGDSYTNQLFNAIVFMVFNNTETYDLLPDHWLRLDDKTSAIVKCLDNPPRTSYFTNAFYTTGMRTALREYFETRTEIHDPKQPHSEAANTYIVLRRLAKSVIQQIMDAQHPDQVIAALHKIPGIGYFNSYQIFVNLTYIPDFPWSENEYTIAGPGCKNGLAHVFVNTDGMTPEEQLFWLRNVLNRKFGAAMQEEWTDVPFHDRCMNVMSMENCMCEFSKYFRAYSNSGKPKMLYVPRKERG